ncbi:hypothetical protein FF38_03336 [Lucilia cuprina]|uniref:Protein TsetseEP domain-containing protein n=1 Tax=Lucilia cuprina TaxID=7375 RepID=A0A0L0C2B2_LUCCU|nr:hypothetical protein FF38_03336 [Lucilia cuprina]
MYNKVSLFIVALNLVLTSVQGSTSYDFIENVEIAAQNLGGINCLINAVGNLEDSVNDFTHDFDACHVRTTDDVRSILKNCADLTDITRKIIMLNKRACKVTAYSSKDTTPVICGSLMKQLDGILTSTETSLNVSLPNTCSKMTAMKFNFKINKFKSFVANCAKIAAA